MKISTILHHYFETAFWSSTDHNDEPLDSKYGYTDLAPETIERAERDIDQFIGKAGSLLDDYDYSQILHDFWLTRNRHGAGFWDGDYEKSIGEKLTKLSHEFGEVNLYVGDDNKLYFDRN